MGWSPSTSKPASAAKAIGGVLPSASRSHDDWDSASSRISVCIVSPREPGGIPHSRFLLLHVLQEPLVQILFLVGLVPGVVAHTRIDGELRIAARGLDGVDHVL